MYPELLLSWRPDPDGALSEVNYRNLNWGFPLMHGNPVNPEWEP